ncbi:Oxidored-FMN domain-containing protein [Mycena chlorophos]|uniref:Oxidored-FMN domain-containing protein n=1 Tax=Mycena chlorophos TaxID=658473 RepID=A0A8H6TGC6_MYCCL|nr:Oxidored-FMN domain-containing protein [Mycena chlorophos]
MSAGLFTPLQIGSITIPNRVGMSALTRDRATDTVPNDIMLKYYLQRAEGGSGLIVSEGVLVTRQGTEWQEAPGLWDQTHVDAWKKITDAVHGAGSKIYAQLWHLGRVSHPDAPQQKKAGVPVYGPSAISARGGKFRFIEGGPGYVTPTAIPDPKTLIALYKQAAVNAKAAGFDGVELHGANGYLVHQFLDSTSNQRTDEYGGSIPNRARFALEAIAALQEVYGPDVAIKLSPNGGYNDMGMPVDETIATFGYLLEELEKLPTPLSYIAITRYNPFLDVEFDGKKRATQFDTLGELGKYVKRAKLFFNSGLQPAEAEELISTGKVQGVFFGMNWLAHPDLAKRIQAGKPLDNQPDFMHLYGSQVTDPAVGYTDYPAAT